MPGRSLHTRYLPLVITTTAGTASAAPLVTTLQTPPLNLDSIHVTIPSGHAGGTGFAVEWAGQRFVPFTNGQDWITADGVDLDFFVDIEIGGPLIFKTYNEGIYDHVHYVRVKVTDLPVASAPVTPVTIIPITPVGTP
jgi:hypothetical protein